MEIKFEYFDNMACNLDNKEIGHWGCCCKCANRIEVHKHCCHSEKTEEQKNDCICGESLKFYVCTAMVEERERSVNLCGTHGVCELFAKIKKVEE